VAGYGGAVDLTPPPADDIELNEVGELIGGYDWLGLACDVIRTLCLMIITVTLIARL
jgi:hypothetical protein